MSETPGFQRLFAELKRRRVFRVAAVYGATAFVVVQVADLLQEALRLPEAFLTGTAVLALLGFPLAIVLAWAYERTSQGVQKTTPAAEGELEAIAAAPAAKRWPLGLAALAGSVLLALGAWWVLGPDAAEAKSYDSIAVLPFVNMTGAPEDEYLGDGMAEELLNALFRIEGLDVASRTSAFAFKGTSVGTEAIADSLGVETVLEGSVRRSPDRLRITVQLIDAETGFHVWSETYDRAPAELLDIQDDLTAQIVRALAVQLGAEESEAEVARGTENAQAYDYFLQGRYFWNKRTAADMEVAIGLFERAIVADSGYASAYAAIADVRVVPTGWRDDPETSLDEAESYARLALAIDPALAQAHAALAYVQMARDLDFVAAEASFERALALDPEYATGHQWYADLLSAMDRHDEAVREIGLAVALDPTMIIVWTAARTLYHAGRYRESIARAQEVIDQGGAYVQQARGYQLDSYEMLGEMEAYLEVLAEFPQFGPMAAEIRDSLAVIPPDEVPAMLARGTERWLPWRSDEGLITDMRDLYFSARAWALADQDEAFERLDLLAADPADVAVRWMWFEVLSDPAFDGLRDDPRFVELNARFRP
jgi:TolB-like protein